jgi:uncharacterized protein YkwD
MRRWIMTAATPVVIACAGATPAVAADPLLAPPSACPDQSSDGVAPVRQEAAMRCLVNFARRAAGLPPLAPSGKLSRSAHMKARLIARCGTLTHTPCGRSWYGVFRAVGFSGSYRENIAAGAGATPRLAMAMWLQSPEHRSALLAPDATVVGVGVRLRSIINGWQGSVWTLHVGRPIPAT